MKEIKRYSEIIGKDETKGLQTPRFRLHSGQMNPSNINVIHYAVVQKEEDLSEVEITNIYKVVDILNEVIDDYHEKHKND